MTRDRMPGRAEAFGQGFAALMKRLNERCAVLATDPGVRSGPAIRREIAAAFEQEVEDLIAAHGVAEPIAEYVRHVVREGFDAAFDLMDTTDGALRARDELSETELPRA